ncbi:MAG: ATP-binding protein [Balneolales bacterium]|nr:ATP-binding protein [Balneolales bacterium]
MEITQELALEHTQLAEIDMHSLVNLVSVISSQLQMLGGSDPCETLTELIQENGHLLQAVKTQNRDALTLPKIKAYGEKLMAVPEKLNAAGCVTNEEDTGFFRESISDIVKIMEVRLKEVWDKWENPDQWHRFEISKFHYDFSRFFGAMEKNSRGRYKIVKNIAAVTEGQDYLLGFQIDSVYDPHLFMPLSVKDVIRDLAANARKYTEPGGTIDIGIVQTEGKLRVVVRDSGMGIPADELSEVVTYGFRASNVKEKVRTMGGGFGLTKAYLVIKGLGGRMWIESEPGKGTVVKFEVPVPERIAEEK